MKKPNKLSFTEVQKIYTDLSSAINKDVYMLEELIGVGKEYSVKEYHEYCQGDAKCKTMYEKTKDLLHIRIMAADIPDAIKWRLLAALYPENYVVKKGTEEAAGHDDFVLEM
jgi:hypothetical protein